MSKVNLNCLKHLLQSLLWAYFTADSCSLFPLKPGTYLVGWFCFCIFVPMLEWPGSFSQSLGLSKRLRQSPQSQRSAGASHSMWVGKQGWKQVLFLHVGSLFPKMNESDKSKSLIYQTPFQRKWSLVILSSIYLATLHSNPFGFQLTVTDLGWGVRVWSFRLDETGGSVGETGFHMLPTKSVWCL